MSNNCNAALEAGFKAIEAARASNAPGMEEQVRKVMMSVYTSDLLMSVRLGNPPTNPMTDPRWW